MINESSSTKFHTSFTWAVLEGNHADRYTTDAIILAIDFNYIS